MLAVKEHKGCLLLFFRKKKFLIISHQPSRWSMTPWRHDARTKLQLYSLVLYAVAAKLEIFYCLWRRALSKTSHTERRRHYSEEKHVRWIGSWCFIANKRDRTRTCSMLTWRVAVRKPRLEQTAACTLCCISFITPLVLSVNPHLSHSHGHKHCDIICTHCCLITVHHSEMDTKVLLTSHCNLIIRR